MGYQVFAVDTCRRNAGRTRFRTKIMVHANDTLPHILITDHETSRCFRSLGPLFTFEIAIRPKHKLVTCGPYAWVRHPSYAGGLTAFTGTSVVFLNPHPTRVGACGIRSWPGMLSLTAWCAMCALILIGTCSRLEGEDQVLRETFREEWEAYQKRVPWRLVPWLF